MKGKRRERAPGGNELWEGHRLIMPEARDKAVHTCGECKFLACIAGRLEKRYGCLVTVPGYLDGSRKVPFSIPALLLTRRVGREGLERVLEGGDPRRPACGFFQPNGGRARMPGK